MYKRPPPSESLLPIFPEGGGTSVHRLLFELQQKKKKQLNCVKEINRNNNEVQKSLDANAFFYNQKSRVRVSLI